MLLSLVDQKGEPMPVRQTMMGYSVVERESV